MLIRSISQTFLRGLAAIVPIVITIYILWWSISLLESFTSGLLQIALPDSLYFPGQGTIFLFLTVFMIGLALKEIHIESLFSKFETNFCRIPVIKSIYGMTKDFMGFLAGSDRKKDFNQVVSVTLPGTEIKMVGFVTNEDLKEHSETLHESTHVAVYLPMGYQIGGYTIIVNRKLIDRLDMDFESAMRFILTAGVAKNQ